MHRNAVDQLGIVTATFTKVQFTTTVFNNGNAFDPVTNFRWTPGRIGIARICAHIGWIAISDAAGLICAVYKNGVLHKYTQCSASGTLGGQGPIVSCLVLVDTITDYFEIFVHQTSGVDRDIEGDSDITWAMFEMLL